MGFTGLARWQNAPTEGLTLIQKNIIQNHGGQPREKWHLTIKSLRSNMGSIPGIQVPVERSMCTVTMKDNVFVLLEDPMAPSRSEIPQQPDEAALYYPPHLRQTYLTLNPPGALEQLLDQLKAPWVATRSHGPTTGGPQKLQDSGHQLSIAGFVFSVGTDWIVRAGNVILAGGTVKGLLLEAEYLPLPTFTQSTAETSELMSNFIMSMLPHFEDAKTVAITISDSQWEEVLGDPEEDDYQVQADRRAGVGNSVTSDDIYISGEDKQITKRKGDWVGVERDRRSAYLIVGGLRTEGLL